jgi:hypothetical protein
MDISTSMKMGFFLFKIGEISLYAEKKDGSK